MVMACGLYAACGGPAPQLDPGSAALGSVSARVHRAATRADEASSTTGSLATRIRFNPAPCECPPWEVELGGAWMRCALVPSRGAAEDLGPALQAAAAGSVWRAVVGVGRSVAESETGWRYRTLEVESAEPDGADPDQGR